MDALDFSDLSEEWVSQPRSSDPPDARGEEPLGDSIRSKTSAHSTRSVANVSKILREKPASSINSQKTNSRRSPHEIPPEAFSGTMQHHEAAQLIAVKHATPEWKKRLLKANGKSQDLFSPIGLENVFRPPTVKIPVTAQSPKRETHSRALPSSPPLLSGHMQQQSSFLGFDESMQLPPIRAVSQTGPRRGSRMRNASDVSSNKSAARHEAFSPASITVGGQRLSQMQSQSRSISARDTDRPHSSMSDSVVYAPAEKIQEEADSVSLPDYSDLDSEQLNLNARIINTKRGGFSHDGSFQVRPLTPSSYQPPAESSVFPDTQSVPVTPKKEAKQDTPVQKASPQQKSSGSPLKLFHQYDTFTNDRLSRRISQFEAVRSSDPLDEQASIPTPSPRKGQALRRKQRMSSFGDGELDQFDFTHVSEKANTPKWPTKRHERTETLEAENVKQADNLDEPSLGMNISGIMDHSSSYLYEEIRTDSESKRGLDVSHKIPDPKRRRMSGKGSASDEGISVPRSRPLVKSTSFIAGKKRKDARHGEHNELADAQVLAERQILDPVSTFRKLSRAFQKLVVDNEAQFIDVNMATDVLADELASLALNVAEDVVHGTRKKSVTTADFFREANLIMQHIRTRAAQGARTASVSVLATGAPRQSSGRMSELFSNDDLDRPASREGDRRPRKRNTTIGTRMVSHLRKFADSDETGLIIDSSSEALRLHHLAGSEDFDSLVSDRSDIRILDPPAPRISQDLETGKINSISTTGTSIPTASSGTRNKATIEPHKVSHLIADTMGGMTFDHERQCWVKRRTSDPAAKEVSRLPSDLTEDDPFADIPDLIEHSVNIKPSKSQKIPSSSRPTTANTGYDHVLQSSGPAIGTRATSWSTVLPSRSLLTDQQRKREQAIESALLREGRSAASQVSSEQPRAVTVCFSSPPIQSFHQPIEITDLEDAEDVETPSKSGWNVEAERIRSKNNLSSSMVRYAPRPLSRIDEMDNSTERSNTTPASLLRQSLVKTPASRQALTIPATGPSYISLRLTPLPDFTIHPVDQSLNLDVKYVARKHGLKNHGEIENQFSISIKNLVAKIADIEPYEPYWEQMKRLDLSKSSLFTLHMLDEFCPRLEKLNVNDGELGQLNGIPAMVRALSVQDNCLSDLTAWHCLQNLQYLDVSGNKLTSLNGFANLIHLREIRADRNQITSIDGVVGLDGLLKLSLRHNSISEVDAKNSKLCRLISLDLSHNQITKLAGLEALPALRLLNLSENKLEKLDLDADAMHEKLEYLNVSTNKLTKLDVETMIGLRDLILDFNGVSTIQGLENHKSIQRVSWRYQKLGAASGSSSIGLDYNCCAETRCLNLSGNRLMQFCPTERFLKLERLDLASCGIKRLSADFGTNLPNLRFLNLNHNAIRDISGLVGLRRLSQVYLVNNRISSIRHIPQTVQYFSKTLEILDLRHNPFSTGFYLTNKENTMQLVVRGQQEGCQKEADPFQDETFLMPDINTAKDAAYMSQIDHGTSMRRRVYELMLTRKCKKLIKLDGRAVDGLVIEDSDRIWKRLLDLGIVCSVPNPRE